MFKVFEKGDFWSDEDQCYYKEREVDDCCSWEAVMCRDGSVMVIEHGPYGVCYFHEIEDDEDDKYRVDRG